MAVANIKAMFHYEIEKVWELVVALDDYSWRSDLSRIEIIEKGKKFVEYTKSGYPTTFTITHFEPCRRYEFDIENSNMFGHWVGLFIYKDDKTLIDFTENITVKSLIMKPFVGRYLKKQQLTYIKDLRNVLENR